MAHNNHVTDGVNKDIRPFPWSDPQECQEYYLDLAKDWEDPYGPPVITKHEGIRVVRDDYLVGSKVRGYTYTNVSTCSGREEIKQSPPRTFEPTR